MEKSMNILSGGAAAALVKALQEAFTRETGARIEGTFSAVGMMRDKLLAGAPCDLVILTAPLVDELIRSGHVVAGSAKSLGRVRTGIALRSGEPPLSIANADDLRAALRGAKGVYFPDAEKSTAGRHFMKVLRTLGLDQELAPVLRQYPNGETAMREMAACDQPGLIGCTQVTEINGTAGVELVALLPAEFELATDYTLGICTGASHPEQARVLAAMLTGPVSAEIRRQGGFEF
jgi:molybdate transport system substrate-binding protein